MTEHTVEPEASTSRDPAVTRPGRSRWQVGLPTLLLLMAAIAVWMTCFLNRRQNARLEARIQALLPLVHELVIDDPAKIAVVKLEEYWYDENRWEVYLPPGDYRLCLATRGVDNQGFPTAMKSVPLAAGRHVLSLEQRLEKDIRRIAVAMRREGAARGQGAQGMGHGLQLVEWDARRDQSSVPGRSARRITASPIQPAERPAGVRLH